jgi:NAD(P)-dependent dehydrogenase (short-subunit alcohol dehydrogenase family)
MPDRTRAGMAETGYTTRVAGAGSRGRNERMEPMAQRAQGTIVVVTGGAQGIGLAIGERYATEGATVVVGDLNADTGREAAARLRGHFIELDVTKTASVTNAAREVFERYGRIDVLVNNAGAAHETDAIEVSDELWNRIIGINLTGTFVASREFAKYFIRQGSGVIVNLASIAAFFGSNPEFHVAYDAAKAGVVQLTRSLAVEWAKYNIRVNALAPGRTRTPILDGVGMNNPQRVEQWLAQVPQGRFFEASEMAALAFFLGSTDSSAITGQTILADGGHMIY